jgi:hypothetical protein
VLSPTEWVRVVNCLIALVCLVLLFRKFARHRGRWSARTIDFWWVLVIWSASAIYAGVEQLLGWETNLRVITSAMALMATLRVLLRTNEADKPTFSKEWWDAPTEQKEGKG